MQEKFSYRNKKTAFWVAVLLALQLLSAIFWAGQKQGFYVDELWSYGLANSYYRPYVYVEGEIEEGWVPGEYFSDYLTVEKEHRFAYDSVFYNQQKDTHPPLFYMVLHTVSSLFPETFSKWYGLIPNLFYFAVTSLLVFLLARKLASGNDAYALTCMMFWGFSIGGLSCVVFIRMYMLLTMWLLASWYLHVCMILENRQTLWQQILLVFITFSGFFTHYYFAILGAFLSAGYLLWLAGRRLWKRAGVYVISMLLSLGILGIVFPDAFIKILGRDANRGVQAYRNLENTEELLPHLYSFLKIFDRCLFGGVFLAFVPVVLMTAGVVWYLNRKRKSRAKIGMHHKRPASFLAPGAVWALGILAADVCIYVVLIALIAPYQADRYIFCTLPIFVIVITAVLFRGLSGQTRKICYPAVVLISGLLMVSWMIQKPNYLYQEKKNNVAYSRQYQTHDCIYITYDYDRYLVTNNLLELMNYRRVRTVKIPGTDYKELDLVLNEAETDPVIYIERGMEVSEIIEYIAKAGGYQEVISLYEDDAVCAFEFKTGQAP